MDPVGQAEGRRQQERTEDLERSAERGVIGERLKEKTSAAEQREEESHTEESPWTDNATDGQRENPSVQVCEARHR